MLARKGALAMMLPMQHLFLHMYDAAAAAAETSACKFNYTITSSLSYIHVSYLLIPVLQTPEALLGK